MKTRIAFFAFAAAAAGCTHENAAALTPLDQAATITVSGANASSSVDLYRQGVLDPIGSQVTIPVSDSDLRLRQRDGEIVVDSIFFALDGMDLPASPTLPTGMKLRNQHLSLKGPIKTSVLERSAGVLHVRVHGSMRYGASMVLDSGALYALGETETAASDLDVRATRGQDGQISITLDASPIAKECWSVSNLVTVSGCSLYVEARGEMLP